MKTLIFDIGNVLVHFRWEEYIKELGFSKEISDKLAKATVQSKWWAEVDRGLEKEEYEKIMHSEHPELKSELDAFFAHTERLVLVYDYAEKLLRQLKEKGYQIYLLSNYGKHMYLQGIERFTFRAYTDGEVISYQVKRIKPEPEIYEMLIRKYGIDPKEAVFIDDNEANVIAGRNAGLQGIVFHDLQQVIRELETMGVVLDQPDLFVNQ